MSILEHLIFAILGGATLWLTRIIVRSGQFDGRGLSKVLFFLATVCLVGSFLVWPYDQKVSGLLSWLAVYSLVSGVYARVFNQKEPVEKK